MTKRARRSFAGQVVALGMLLGATGTGLAEQRRLLVTKVDWVDSGGQRGVMLFQGEVTDGVLTGRVYPGDGSELAVVGTVAAGGTLTGTLVTIEGQDLADFSGQLNAALELEGVLTLQGEAAAEWAAPAQDLPAS
jgi:hypothetical protein